MGHLRRFLSHPSTRQVTLGGLDGGLVIGCGEGGLQIFLVRLRVGLLKGAGGVYIGQNSHPPSGGFTFNYFEQSSEQIMNIITYIYGTNNL